MTDASASPADLPPTLARLVRRLGAQVVQTHISWVLLTPTLAYKIKKPVNLGFLDFSTAALREAACHEELRLNRRTAPDLYLGVVPIRVDAAGGWTLDAAAADGATAAPGAAGPLPPAAQGLDSPVPAALVAPPHAVADWAVVMRRFDDTQRLDRLAERGALTAAMIDALALAVVDLHAAAAVAVPQTDWGSPARAWAPVAQTLDALQTHTPAPAAPVTAATACLSADAADLGAPAKPTGSVAPLAAAPGMLAEIRSVLQTQAQRLAPLQRARQLAGHVREGHGDLHLANLVVVQGRVRLFDALEFDPALRWIDTANDLAFVWMDLVARDQGGLAACLLSAVWGANGDWQAAELLPFYAVYRALVRAKVAGISPGAPTCGPGSVAAYLGLAQRLLEPPPVQLVLTHGPSGCGKTVASGAWLAAQAHGRALRLRSDLERQRLSAAAEPATRYAPAQRAAVYAHLLAQTQALLRGGWSVVVDAAFLQRAERAPFIALARTLRVPVHILAPQADAAELARRIRARAAARTDASEATPAVLAQQLAQIEPLSADESRLLQS